jgi:hypothetical protein
MNSTSTDEIPAVTVLPGVEVGVYTVLSNDTKDGGRDRDWGM